MALVVLLLLAISLAGAAGYLVVSSEFTMARHAGQGGEALAVARGGLYRFVAEQLGPVADSARYAIGNGEAAVTARKLAEVDALTDVYYVRSEGFVIDPTIPDAPAARVVGGYAYHRRRPLRKHGTVVIDVQNLQVLPPGGSVTGHDVGGATCPGGAAPSIAGAIGRNNVTGPPGLRTGSPADEVWPGGYPQLLSRIGLRWDVLADPAFPVDYEDAPPSWGSIPADQFPVVRYNGSLHATAAWSGRGVLLVTGRFDSSDSFRWDGIVLAGWVDERIDGDIDGMLVGGFANHAPYTQTQIRGAIRYHSCNVDRANESLSYLELVESSLFEPA